jgi:ABC-type multidrug transport system fused ATPase/permease subunit
MLRRSALTALVVGTVLVTINQGTELAAFTAAWWANWSGSESSGQVLTMPVPAPHAGWRYSRLLLQCVGLRAVPSARQVLAAYLRPQVGRTFALGLLVVAAIGLDLANPQILRAFVDAATQTAPLERLLAIAVLFLAVALASQVVVVAESYLAEDVGLTATNAMRADLTLHCLRLDPDFYASHTPGELIERVDGDINTLSNFFSRFVVYVIGNGLLVIGLVILLIPVDWRIALTLGVAAALGLLVMDRLRNVAIPLWGAARQASAELFGFLEERLAGTEDIRAAGATGYVMRRFYERSRHLLRRDLVANFSGSIALQSAGVLLMLATAGALALSGSLFLSGAISLGSVYLVFAYTQVLYRPIEQISRQLQDLQQAGASLRRIQQLFAERSSIVDGTRSLPPGPLGVELRNVTFGYVPDEPVLQDISFQLEPGAVLGVLGRTGIGKSTLAKLLLRLHDINRGQICLGGLDLRQVRLDSLRQRVGLVTQEIQIFHASVRDNLSIFDSRLDDVRMVQVLEELGLGDWLRRLPHGLDTVLASKNAGMSAGEAQLLAFARVFLRDPGLVILDEASSRLDPASERRLEAAIDRLLDGRTGLVIAHRLATLQRVDHILIFGSDGIREWGTRRELERDPGSTFSRLLRAGAAELLG